MKISILGTGNVGKTIAKKLQSLGHQVFMGTRDANKTKMKEKFASWFDENSDIQIQPFADLPAESELFINATGGIVSLEALSQIGKDKLAGKVILDLANPLDGSAGMPPVLAFCNTESLGERIQMAFPKSMVVKSLNTMSCELMMDPSILQGDHSVFVSGEDSSAKDTVKNLLNQIGWKSDNIIDLGGIETARGTEMLLPVWLRLWQSFGSADFNFNIVKK